MKDIEWRTFNTSYLIEIGDGNIQKGIEIINDDRWEIIDEYSDLGTGEIYYRTEREKIDEAEFDENSKI